MRRIVTEERGGRSAVALDGTAPRSWCDEIWMTTEGDPLGFDPAGQRNPLSAPAGGTFFRMVELPPDAVMRARLAEGGTEGVDAEGFHRTPTVDYVYVLDGPVELVLDDASVVVQPGDCVIQRGTNHAWRNHGDAPIRLLTVMVGVEDRS